MERRLREFIYKYEWENQEVVFDIQNKLHNGWRVDNINLNKLWPLAGKILEFKLTKEGEEVLFYAEKIYDKRTKRDAEEVKKLQEQRNK